MNSPVKSDCERLILTLPLCYYILNGSKKIIYVVFNLFKKYDSIKAYAIEFFF
jgi:hypothetical protein